MIARNKLTDTNTTPITIDIHTLMSMLGVGRNTALMVADEAGAVLHIGSRKLYNVEKIKAYIDKLTEYEPIRAEQKKKEAEQKKKEKEKEAERGVNK